MRTASPSIRGGSPPIGVVDPRALPLYGLYRRVRHLVLAKSVGGPEELARTILHALVDEGHAPPVFPGGARYERRDDHFEMVETIGFPPTEPDRDLATDEPVLRAVTVRGWALVERWEQSEPTALAFVAFGPGRDHLLALRVAQPGAPEELAYALATLASAADTALSRHELSSFLAQATEIQTSLLPKEIHPPPGFEVGVRTRPAAIVGGDIYDATEVQGDTLALALADATGHGLPAALQARDVVVGLRMGAEQNLKMLATIERLDRVLARSGTTGRFISLVYVEVDRDGHLIYVNAGHVPPFLIRARGEVIRLPGTGPVLGLGLSSTHRYARAFERLEVGDRLVLPTDGLLEVTDEHGRELGDDGFAEILRLNPHASSQELVERVFETVDRFAAGRPQIDDQTLLVLTRTPAP